jgi:hypothetical protein
MVSKVYEKYDVGQYIPIEFGANISGNDSSPYLCAGKGGAEIVGPAGVIKIDDQIFRRYMDLPGVAEEYKGEYLVVKGVVYIHYPHEEVRYTMCILDPGDSYAATVPQEIVLFRAQAPGGIEEYVELDNGITTATALLDVSFPCLIGAGWTVTNPVLNTAPRCLAHRIST